MYIRWSISILLSSFRRFGLGTCAVVISNTRHMLKTSSALGRLALERLALGRLVLNFFFLGRFVLTPGPTRWP